MTTQAAQNAMLAQAMADAGGMAGDGGMGGGGMMMMFAMMVGVVVFLVLLIAGVVWLVRSLANGGRGGSGRNRTNAHSALQLLDERLARGEIEPAEYRERRSTLEE